MSSAKDTMQYVKLQALIHALLEDAVNFEEKALEEIGGKKILAFINKGNRTPYALNDLYILKLLEYVARGGEYTPAHLAFLIDYVTHKYPLRAKIKDFMEKLEELLMSEARE